MTANKILFNNFVFPLLSDGNITHLYTKLRVRCILVIIEKTNTLFNIFDYKIEILFINLMNAYIYNLLVTVNVSM